MIVPRRPLSRRTVLRGLGAAVALPLLDAMVPSFARAAEARPVRAAFLFVPNGKHMPSWTPREGTPLPPILEPLRPHKDELLVLSGLTLDGGRAHGDGPGDHARAAASFLTAAHPRKTGGADIRAGVSVDQVAATSIGSATRFRSLQLGCERGAQSGECDSGYSCAYSSYVSWRSPTTPAAKETDPRQVFDRLFLDGRPGETAESRKRRVRDRKSVLDFVLDDAGRLRGRLGTTDRRKLDEYLTGVRELERRIQLVERSRAREPDALPMPAPTGIPREYQAHVRVLCDLLVLAFRADLTRVASFMLGNAGSNRSYRFLGVPEGHHGLSHHGKDPAKQAKIERINTFHTRQLAYLLDRMRAVPDGDGTLLDHAMVLYGSGIADGNYHNHDDLPILLAGRGGGLRPGRHLRYARETPLANLYVSMLDRMGVPTKRFGDSSGPLPSL